MSNVPNLVGNTNIGQGTATTVFLRGIGSTESIVTLETALGFYIDDVYISRQGVNNLSLYDVERIEEGVRARRERCMAATRPVGR